jgi:hypothetical protein
MGSGTLAELIGRQLLVLGSDFVVPVPSRLEGRNFSIAVSGSCGLRLNMPEFRVTYGLICALSTLVLFGCGGRGGGKPTAHLQGTVTIARAAIPADAQASITFKPTVTGQARSTSAQISGGKYDAPDVPVGAVTVYFNVQQATGRMVREGTGSPYREMHSLVPEKYGTGMALEVLEDNSDQNFNLQ